MRRYFAWSWNEWLPGPWWMVPLNAGGTVLNLVFVVLHIVAWSWSWWTLGNIAALLVCGYSTAASWRARRNATWRWAMFDAKVMKDIWRDVEREVQRREREASWN